MRARQQEALARLGERALAETDLQKFFNELVTTVADILDVELVKILELVPGDAELLLRAGSDGRPPWSGRAHVSTGRDSHAGYTLASGRPVIMEDLTTETRFPGTHCCTTKAIVSGITTPIAGRDGRAYGVLCAHSIKRRKFHDYDVSFLAAVSNVVAGVDPAPATGPAPGADDPRAASPFRQPVFATARLVLTDREEFAQRFRSGDQIRSARAWRSPMRIA